MRSPTRRVASDEARAPGRPVVDQQHRTGAGTRPGELQHHGHRRQRQAPRPGRSEVRNEDRQPGEHALPAAASTSTPPAPGPKGCRRSPAPASAVTVRAGTAGNLVALLGVKAARPPPDGAAAARRCKPGEHQPVPAGEHHQRLQPGYPPAPTQLPATRRTPAAQPSCPRRRHRDTLTTKALMPDVQPDADAVLPPIRRPVVDAGGQSRDLLAQPGQLVMRDDRHDPSSTPSSAGHRDQLDQQRRQRPRQVPPLQPPDRRLQRMPAPARKGVSTGASSHSSSRPAAPRPARPASGPGLGVVSAGSGLSSGRYPGQCG